MNEIWKDIKGYEGLYQISNFGRIKSILSNKFLKAGKANGYRNVVLYKNKLKKTFNIHRLICINFISNPYNKPCVNHINGIKSDNRLENLEWVTHSENKIHAFKIGLESKKGEKHHFSKLNEKQAIKIKYEHKDLSQKEIAKIYKIDSSSVSNIRRGVTWTEI